MMGAASAEIPATIPNALEGDFTVSLLLHVPVTSCVGCTSKMNLSLICYAEELIIGTT